ncbi:MAG: ORF6N domain-containing protein [Cyclobacteriaceae bacterium]
MKQLVETEYATLIFTVRGVRVMFDFHLFSLYVVETCHLKQSVTRNLNRFPGDLMFILEENEVADHVSRNVKGSRHNNM